ncbi:MAG: hypothetical protein WBY93_10120 [Candidatus Binatus sp.]
MESDKPANRNKLKERLRTIVGTGASTIVLATTILGAIPAGADVADSSPGDSLKQRVEKVRPQAQDANANLQQQGDSKIQLAWWRNWRNGGWRGWGWPNWHNWHNWGNW